MKKITRILTDTLFLFLFCTQFVSAQAPKKFLYQGEARDSRGKILVEESLSILISIMDCSEYDANEGCIIYQEKHNTQTDINGLFNINIGEGSVSMGSFEQIFWGYTDYFLNVQIAVGVSDNYDNMGTTQLLSVPYALHANTVESLDGLEDELSDLLAEGHSHTLEEVLNNGNSAGNNQLKGLKNPTENQDAATKAYVDALTDILRDEDIIEVDFTSEKQFNIIGEEVNFISNISLSDVELYWDFGDGNTSSEQNPLHIYTELGEYTVTLKVTKGPLTFEEKKVDYIQVRERVQTRLNNGETPLEIYNDNNLFMDSLFGKFYQGGIICYLNTDDGSGLLAAPSGWNKTYTDPSLSWADNTSPTYSDGKIFGTGKDNTKKIINTLSPLNANSAAQLCDDFVHDGYDDWFLPSVNELAYMRELALKGIGGFSFYIGSRYWSSTEYDINRTHATTILMYYNQYYISHPILKTIGSYRVRPARYF